MASTASRRARRRDARRHFPSRRGVRVAVLGLAFKPGTDDVRESPAIPVVRALLAEEAEVRAYDPIATYGAARVLADAPPVALCDTLGAAIDDAQAIVLLTSWDEFRALPGRLYRREPQPVVVDGRRLLARDSVSRTRGIGLASEQIMSGGGGRVAEAPSRPSTPKGRRRAPPRPRRTAALLRQRAAAQNSWTRRLAARELVLDPGRPRGEEAFYPARASSAAAACCAAPAVQTPAHIFGDYAYFSPNPTAGAPRRAVCRAMMERFGFDGTSQVVEVASNDGYLLAALPRSRRAGLASSPAANVARVAEEAESVARALLRHRDGARHRGGGGGAPTSASGNNVLATCRTSTTSWPASATAEAARRGDARVPAPRAADGREPGRHDLPRALSTSRSRRSSGCSRRTA